MPVSMSPGARYAGSNNFQQRVIMGPRLDDRRIARYEKAGYYTLEARQARSEYRKKLAATRASRRDGNFYEVDGRLIYSP